MPDFPAMFIDSPGIILVPLAEPINYGAVIMPFTANYDLIPPVTSATPQSPGPITKSSPIVINVSDSNAIVSVVVSVHWPGWHEVIWPDPDDPNKFTENYQPFSTRVGNVFTIRRNGGWPESLDSPIKIQVIAVDEEGNVS